jgi:hypothetical protein
MPPGESRKNIHIPNIRHPLFFKTIRAMTAMILTTISPPTEVLFGEYVKTSLHVIIPRQQWINALGGCFFLGPPLGTKRFRLACFILSSQKQEDSSKGYQKKIERDFWM